MKKTGGKLLPYFAGVFFPLLFAIRAPQEPSVWVKAAAWLGVQIVLTLAVDAVGRRKGLRQPVRTAIGIWLALFVQVLVRGVVEPSVLEADRTRAGLLFLFILYFFLMIFAECFGGKRPAPSWRNTLGLTALMLIMPVILMGVGIFNHVFFVIGVGWGLLTLLVLILRVWSEQKDAPPEEEEKELPPDEDLPGRALFASLRWLSWLAVIAVVILTALAAKKVVRIPQNISEKKAAVYYTVYEPDADALKKAAGTDDIRAAILSLCEFERDEEIAGAGVWSHYKPKGLEAFFPEADASTMRVGTYEEAIFVEYTAKDGKEVGLSWSTDDGKEYIGGAVYDPERDVCFERRADNTYWIWRRFRGD